VKSSSLTLGLAVVVGMAVVGHGAPVQSKVIEVIDDACSGDVVVKVPWTEPDAPSLDSNDIILARSKALCERVAGSPPTHKGVCQRNSAKMSQPTDPIPYSSIQNKDRRFRWFCNRDAERSRCKEGTKRVRFLIGPDGLFQTHCLD
jgi:hypothetical protein